MTMKTLFTTIIPVLTTLFFHQFAQSGHMSPSTQHENHHCETPEMALSETQSPPLKNTRLNNARHLLEELKELNPVFTCLYQSRANDWIEESLETHTLKALNQFDNQFEHYDIDFQQRIGKLTLTETLQLALLLHDLGKPLAYQRLGSTKYQSQFNRPSLLAALKWLEVQTENILLIDALTSNDTLGQLFQGQIDVITAISQVREQAELSGLTNAQAFFTLQWVFYISDATSHDWLREKFFESDDTGQLWPKQNGKEHFAKIINELR